MRPPFIALLINLCGWQLRRRRGCRGLPIDQVGLFVLIGTMIVFNFRNITNCMSSEQSEPYMSDGEDSQMKHRPKQTRTPKPKPKDKILVNISDCQYPVVTRVSKGLGWKTQKNPDATDWDIMWTDNAVQPETLLRMEHHQKINHFPGMFHLARKNLMGRYLMKMRKKFAEDYSFFPMTWMLPVEYHDLKAYFDAKPKGKARTFIVKPEAMSQGKGIFLTRKIDDIEPGSHCVVQRYLHKPYLIEGLKFDLRIYVLVASVDPLRLYIFNEGLARFATEQYVPPTRENMEDVCMHLTNYAINKDNPKFVFNSSEKDMTKGHKRSLTWLYDYLAEHEPRSAGLQQKINDMIVKTMLSGLPPITNQYRSCQPENFASNMCFELLGFDVILTDKCEPVLLEINHTPSFSTDTPLDNLIKTAYIRDSLTLMNVSEKTKLKIIQERKQACQQRVLTGKKVKLNLEEKEALKKKAMEDRNKFQNKNLGGFKKIYPVDDKQKMQKFEQFLSHSDELYQISTGTRRANNSVSKKVEKSQSAFGTCFVKKPKETFPKSHTALNSRIAVKSNKDSNNITLNRKCETKKAIGLGERGQGLLHNNHTHSENLILDSASRGLLFAAEPSSKTSSNQQRDDEDDYDMTNSEGQPHMRQKMNSQENMSCHEKAGSSTDELCEIVYSPKLHHTLSSKEQPKHCSVSKHGKSNPARSPLEENKYCSQNKIEEEEEEEHHNLDANRCNSIGKNRHKNFNLLQDFKQKHSSRPEQLYSSTSAANPAHKPPSPLLPSQPQPFFKISSPFNQTGVKSVDILFDEADFVKSAGLSTNGKRNNSTSGRAGFEGSRNSTANNNNSNRVVSLRNNNETEKKKNKQEAREKQRHMAARQKIPIMLNTLLINGSEGATVISANNLRKILNHYPK